jgi:hypothetical protein
MPGGTAALHIDPVGNDTWNFAVTFFELDFADGTSITGGSGALSLSQNRRDGSFPISAAGTGNSASTMRSGTCAEPTRWGAANPMG